MLVAISKESLVAKSKIILDGIEGCLSQGRIKMEKQTKPDNPKGLNFGGRTLVRVIYLPAIRSVSRCCTQICDQLSSRSIRDRS